MNEPENHHARRRDRAEGLAATIAEHGWAVIGVFPTDGNPDMTCCYTVGLSPRSLPELAVYGLPLNAGAALLNAAAKSLVERGATWADGEFPTNLTPEHTVIQRITMTDTSDLAEAKNFYNKPILGLQLVWSDNMGRLPWETGCDPNVAAVQPVRGQHPTARELFLAQRLPVENIEELQALLGAEQGQLHDADRGVQFDNNNRSRRGAHALLCYVAARGSGGDDMATLVADMQADIQHLCDAIDVDWHEAIDKAESTYRAEIFGEL
ncbi:hypothetical protein A5768_26325 [Mycolicibacterium fortuitum]|uniref:DUF4262 domain-containing protein n=1 Tax=Mycolicibacterium fortuitum TaxID=1766 RepID=UPI0007EBDDB7|nr:DUF4262 domain-containing protein [Mycolicibacterium fortuitum]OBG21620.1 hypothetical protein A5768_26325 [Mycolicibacterium fortuitum]